MLLFVGIAIIGFGIGYGTGEFISYLFEKTEKSKKTQKYNPWAGFMRYL